jgi:hypothetical protein
LHDYQWRRKIKIHRQPKRVANGQHTICQRLFIAIAININVFPCLPDA